jgi:hypothetical protein
MSSESRTLIVPNTRVARWQLLEGLILEWHGKGERESGYSSEEIDAGERRLGMKLPVALREWYALTGRRKDIWNQQDRFLPPEDLEVIGGVLELFVENQGVTSWGVRESDLRFDDPPVVTMGNDERWAEQCAEVSEFALQMFFYCLQFTASKSFYGFADDSCVERIEAEFPKLPLPAFLFCGEEVRFFGFEDLVVKVDPTRHVSVAAVSERLLGKGRQIVEGDDFEE